MTTPLISIIVPCYNQAQYLDECLQSILDQTYTNWECIMVNDGSPDNTEEIAKKWVEKDSRFIYLKKENGGLSSARNAGIEIANGEWIQFLDCDDTLVKNKFQKSSIYFETSSVIISQFNILKNNLKLPGYCFLNATMFNFNSILLFWGTKVSIPIHCGLIKKSLLSNFKFDVSIQSMEDWLMWLHIFNQNPNSSLVDEPLANYRKDDDDSMSADLIKLVHQKIKLLPQIKLLYGEKNHDLLAYHEIKEKSINTINLKKELQKIQNDFFISKYLSLKKKYYQIKTKND